MPGRKRERGGDGGDSVECGNGHPLLLVPREVRRLEKDLTWSCDGNSCPIKGEEGIHTERPRYRCVHYHSSNKCNYDLCGDCLTGGLTSPNISPGGTVRRSSREPKPSSKGEEWEVEKSPPGKTRKLDSSPRKEESPLKEERSPGRVSRRSRDIVGSPGSAERRPTRGTPASPIAVKGKEDVKEGHRRGQTTPKRNRSGTEEGGHDTDEDTPFYTSPPHVRFSPSVKTGSPFGRKTRSSRRGISSYIQSLPSEDEQSEFNKQYSRDLRKRQQRKASEEERVASQGEPESSSGVRRSGRRSLGEDIGMKARGVIVHESESGGEELSLAARKRNMRNKNRKDEESGEEADCTDPTITEEACVRRSSRRRERRTDQGEEADTESGIEKEIESEVEEDTEQDTPVAARRSRRVIAASSEEETPEVKEKRGGRKTRIGMTPQSEEEETVPGRRISQRSRVPVDRLQYKPEERSEDDGESEEDEEEQEEEEEEEEEEEQEVAEKKGSPNKRGKYGLREKRTNTRRYTADFPGNDDRSNRDKGLIRREAMGQRDKRPAGKKGGKKKNRRRKTGDSSSPSDSFSSDEEAFDKRKSKRMLLEREKLRPMNMDKKDVTKAIFKDRAKAGASLADVQPMEMDMGVTFESVGGLKEHVNALKEMVMFPLLYPELFEQLSIQPPRGVLFYGPPGTGKTLLARALACECSNENRKVAFFMRKGADCLSKWIGESERQLRLLFDQAYQMRPSIIFFDEIDGLAPVRSSRQDQIHSSIVSTLLALMDGLDNRGEIVLIGATNRIENIDPALRRPGRFDRELRFALPCRKTRKEILKLHTKSWQPGLSDPLMNTLSARTIGYCGADLKGLTAEAALNALRRVYPQVYQSNQKLGIDITKVDVTKVDFDKAIRKIVPSTHRVEDQLLGPLPKHIRPLLQETVASLTRELKRVFPHSTAGKGAVLPATLTHRPRLLILSNEGQGQTTYIGPALLHVMEKLPCQKLDVAALFSNSARTPEEAVCQLIHNARRTQPGILYIPHLLTLWDTISETVRATLVTLLTDLPPKAPLFILAVATSPYSALPTELQEMFVQFYRETFRIEHPGENERMEYFRPLVTSCSTHPPKASANPPPTLETLPVLPAPESRALTAKEEKRLRRKEEHLLRELRIFLRDIWAKMNKESKFFMFRVPVNTEEVDDYLEFVTEPMDLEKMHMKLDDGDYSCAQDFLNDVDLMAENAISYNCDLAYETNRIICHRSRALQDFAYALVKSEMDTDFEDECKEIVVRRKAVTEKLTALDKESKKLTRLLTTSPGKMVDMLAIVSAACQVCSSKDDEDSMLLCDGCDDGCHTYCMTPVMEEVPEGDWFCKKCEQNESGRGSVLESGERRKRRRKSAWSSGKVASTKKKPAVKKKILESDDEKIDEDKEAAKEKVMEGSEQIKPTEETTEKIIPDEEEPSSPIAGSSRMSFESSSMTPVVAENIVPTGVRVDNSKLLVWAGDLVRATEGFTVEKLERVYTAMAKVIRVYRLLTDRTNLPTDLQAELEVVKSQEKEFRVQERENLGMTGGGGRQRQRI